MKRLGFIALTISFILLSACTAYAGKIYTEGMLQYTIDGDNTISIVGYYGDADEYTIPWMIGLKEVKSIESGAFKESDVSTVHIPNNEVNVASGAFRDSQETDMYNLGGESGITIVKQAPIFEIDSTAAGDGHLSGSNHLVQINSESDQTLADGSIKDDLPDDSSSEKAADKAVTEAMDKNSSNTDAEASSDKSIDEAADALIKKASGEEDQKKNISREVEISFSGGNISAESDAGAEYTFEEKDIAVDEAEWEEETPAADVEVVAETPKISEDTAPENITAEISVPETPQNDGSKSEKKAAIIIIVVLAAFALGDSVYHIIRNRKKKK